MLSSIKAEINNPFSLFSASEKKTSRNVSKQQRTREKKSRKKSSKKNQPNKQKTIKRLEEKKQVGQKKQKMKNLSQNTIIH
jgi:hypothetical protein